MGTNKSQISLYKKIDNDLLEKIGVQIETYLRYTDDSEDKIIDVEERSIAINEVDEGWSPNDHELSLNMSLKILEPMRLFGKNSITSAENTLGIGCHIYSKESHFQRTVPVGRFKSNNREVNINFDYTFPPSSLKGQVYIEFFVYLAEIKERFNYQADKAGMILTEENFLELELIVDGDGSVFPITEFNDKEGPLWKLEKHWVDASDAIFNSSNVSLSLNASHPLFDQIQKGKTRVSRAMMGDIMIQAMSQIIQQVLIIENNNINDDNLYPNSILAAVKYWVESFEIEDTSSLFSISNSMRAYWERRLMRGENEND